MEDIIKIGGLEKFSLVNWPGVTCCVIFTQGCNWACPFCYSGDLVPFNVPFNADKYSWEDVINFLKSRIGKLDGVVFSGGEPLMQKNIKIAMENVKDLGFKIGLHTNGSKPLVLKEIIHLLSWVGIDVKAIDKNYKIATGGCGNFNDVLDSLQILLENKINFEARTTLDPRIISVSDLFYIAKILQNLGVKKYAIQEYILVAENLPLAPSLKERKKFFVPEIIDKLKPMFDEFMVRN